MKRSLHLTAELLRRYSRRGNFHSDVDAAATIGYSRLVAQGMQAAAPAYGLLLDEWGDDQVQLPHPALMATPGGRAHQQLAVDEFVAVPVVREGEHVVASPNSSRDRHSHTVRSAVGGRQGGMPPMLGIGRGLE